MLAVEIRISVAYLIRGHFVAVRVQLRYSRSVYPHLVGEAHVGCGGKTVGQGKVRNYVVKHRREVGVSFGSYLVVDSRVGVFPADSRTSGEIPEVAGI